MPNLGTLELIIILLIVLLLFGSKKLPELAKSVGSSARELRKGLSGDEEDKKTAKSKSTAKKEEA